jgi:pilus assembly protein Flp/PilA
LRLISHESLEKQKITLLIVQKPDFICLLFKTSKTKPSCEAFPGNPKERRTYTMLFSPKEKGQGLVEYALILVLVAVVVIVALSIPGPIIGNVFSDLDASLIEVSG